ncbi:MAG: hypothetical protein ACYCSQ_00670 [bacterium]
MSGKNKNIEVAREIYRVFRESVEQIVDSETGEIIYQAKKSDIDVENNTQNIAIENNYVNNEDGKQLALFKGQNDER